MVPGYTVEGDSSLPDCGDRLVELVPLIWEPSGVRNVAGVDDEVGVVLEIILHDSFVEWGDGIRAVAGSRVAVGY